MQGMLSHSILFCCGTRAQPSTRSVSDDQEVSLTEVPLKLLAATKVSF